MAEFTNKLRFDSVSTQKALLLAVLSEGKRVWQIVKDRLSVGLFTHPDCMGVFAAVSECDAADEPINFQTVFDRMPHRHMENVLSFEELRSWAGHEDGVLVTEQILLNMINVLRRTAYRRGLPRLFEKMEACENAGEGLELARDYCHEFAYAAMRASEDEAAMAAVLENCRLAAEGKPPKHKQVQTGIGCLDSRIGGLKRGNMLVLSARTSQHKSSLAHQLALNIAGSKLDDRPLRVGLFNYELTSEQVYERLLGNLSGIGYAAITRHKVRPEDMQRIAEASEALNSMFLRVYPPSPTFAEIEREQMAHAFDVIVIDQLQDAVLANARLFEQQGMRLGTTVMAHRFKNLANMDPKSSVVVLSHVRRPLAGSKAGSIEIEDLKESGAIEERADVVLLGRWPTKYDRAAPANLYELKIAKNRQAGLCERLQLYVELPSVRFRDLTMAEAAMFDGEDDDHSTKKTKRTKRRADTDG